MTPADPTLRGLLLSLAEGDGDTLPALADYLEEMGDARAEEVRKLLCARPVEFRRMWHLYDPVTMTGVGPMEEDREACEAGRIPDVLVLFAEGPRWRAISVRREDGDSGIVITMIPPHRNSFLTPAAAQEAATSPLGYVLPVGGPYWPEDMPDTV